jgi:predicted lipoprotein with Yx(FWY)xxD motif
MHAISGIRQALATRPRRTAVLLSAVALPAALVLAACGSSSTSSSSTSSTSASSSSAHSELVVRTMPTSSFGTILVDTSGKTLYTFTNNGHPVSCTGACASLWPPLTVPSGVTPTGSSGVSGLGITTANGVRQVTHGGLPLFSYKGDSSAGSTSGNGINSFGGIWRVARAAAGASAAASSSAPSTTSSGGGSGY